MSTSNGEQSNGLQTKWRYRLLRGLRRQRIRGLVFLCARALAVILGAACWMALCPSLLGQVPQFKARVICEKNERTKPLYAGLNSTMAVGEARCGEEVVLPEPDVTLVIDPYGSIVIEPHASETYSPELGDLRVEIVLAKSGRRVWLSGRVEILPNQRFEIAVLGKAVDPHLCDAHHGVERIEPSPKQDPLRLSTRTVVCNDGTRIAGQ